MQCTWWNSAPGSWACVRCSARRWRLIVVLLSKEITRLVLVANLVAWPLAYLAMGAWLDGFAYHMDPDVGVFIGGGVLVLGIAWVSVGYHALRAARTNPVEALRTE